MNYKKKTFWFTLFIVGLIILLMIGGYRERGYFAFDGAFLILILSPVLIKFYYEDWKKEYQRRKV